MRNIKCIFLVAVGSFLWTSCNSKKADKATEVSKVTTEVSANKTEISEEDYKEGKWLDELSAKTPLTFTELEALLPNSLLGMPLLKTEDVSKNEMSAIKAVYTLDSEPTKESVLIDLFIMDGAGNDGYKHLKATFKMLEFPTNKEDDTKILKITDWKNKRLLTRQNLIKERWHSEKSFIKKQRFHVKMDGKNLKVEQLQEPIHVLDELDFL
ncbi:hypothetical protein [Flavobacterium sp.]|uniref:hypothetical protein n=1 Tax=Flavobacterium sp. TaxID=239 RepID=UPI002608B636|nr:hypothetical protein [Flavobacterium sp.]MDD2986046.1 hypothetical protein [Flavobacterium sp.]